MNQSFMGVVRPPRSYTNISKRLEKSFTEHIFLVIRQKPFLPFNGQNRPFSGQKCTFDGWRIGSGISDRIIASSFYPL